MSHQSGCTPASFRHLPSASSFRSFSYCFCFCFLLLLMLLLQLFAFVSACAFSFCFSFCFCYCFLLLPLHQSQRDGENETVTKGGNRKGIPLTIGTSLRLFLGFARVSLGLVSCLCSTNTCVPKKPETSEAQRQPQRSPYI